MTGPINVATATGQVDLLAPDGLLVTAEAIAHGLSRINRWNGATESPITVAQHSLLVADIFRRQEPRLAPWSVLALLHDAHEYLLGDLVTPTVRLMEIRLPGLARHIEIEKRRLDLAIREALGIPSPPAALATALASAVTMADLAAYDVEWRSLMPASNGASPFAAHRSPAWLRGMRLKALPSETARERFLAAVREQLLARPWAATGLVDDHDRRTA